MERTEQKKWKHHWYTEQLRNWMWFAVAVAVAIAVYCNTNKLKNQDVVHTKFCGPMTLSRYFVVVVRGWHCKYLCTGKKWEKDKLNHWYTELRFYNFRARLHIPTICRMAMALAHIHFTFNLLNSNNILNKTIDWSQKSKREKDKMNGNAFICIQCEFECWYYNKTQNWLFCFFRLHCMYFAKYYIYPICVEFFSFLDIFFVDSSRVQAENGLMNRLNVSIRHIGLYGQYDTS